MGTSHDMSVSTGSVRPDQLRSMSMEPWFGVGDPLAEAVVIDLRTRRIPLANPLPAIRRLAAQGDAVCRSFLDDLEMPAGWADFAHMRLGAAMVNGTSHNS